MPMFGEPYDGLLVGGSLTLITSVIILLLTNRSAEKLWLKQRAIDIENRAVEEVYSPLYFTLWDLFVNCAFLSGEINATLEQKRTTLVNPPFWLKEYQCGGKLSKNIREILVGKLGLVSPKGLRDDLFYFFKHVETLECKVNFVTLLLFL